MTFETEGADQDAACVFDLARSGGIRNGSCLVTVSNAPVGNITGKLQVAGNCSVSATVNMPGIGNYGLIARLAADKSTIAGVLLNPATSRFLPLAVTRWDTPSAD